MSDFNYDLELDRTRKDLLLTPDSGFLSAVMYTLDFKWDSSISTAATDGLCLYWNKEFFKKLSSEERLTVLMHEILHVALLHNVRRGNRDAKEWNIACDLRINNTLVKEFKRKFKNNLEDCIINENLDSPTTTIGEEEVFNLIHTISDKDKEQALGDKAIGKDISSKDPADNPNLTPEQVQTMHNQQIANVVSAVQQAEKLSKNAGYLPGNIKTYLDSFLNPVINWRVLLKRYMTNLGRKSINWKRPSRRYQSFYMPGKIAKKDKLAHLMYFFDVSGSVSDEDIECFNSEVKEIHKTLKPKKITIVQFDTQIHSVTIVKDTDSFKGINVEGRGGTSLVEVRAMMLKHKPTASIIFSDMYCNPMKPLPYAIPTIWVALNNKQFKPPFGEVIHINSEE